MPDVHTYQTGNTDRVESLMDIIVTFAQGLGWTLVDTNVDEWEAAVPATFHRTSRYLQSPLGEYYFLSTGSLLTNQYYIHTGTFQSYTRCSSVGALNWPWDQAGANGRAAYTNYLTGPYTAYHLFGGKEGVRGCYIYCVVEYTAGSFSHFGIGELDMIGDRKGRFAVNTNFSGSVDAIRNWAEAEHQYPFHGFNSTQNTGNGHVALNYFNPQRGEPGFNPAINECYYFGNTSSPPAYGGVMGTGVSGQRGLNSQLFYSTPSHSFGRHILLPGHVVIDLGGLHRIVGLAPAWRFLSMENLNDGDIVENNWKAFSCKSSTASTGAYSSTLGIAYRFQ